MRKFQFPLFSSRKSASAGWIVVFLGNPGARYADTRHNAGFMVARKVSDALGARVNNIKFRSLTALTVWGGERALLMCPQTYMNLSGEAVREAMSFYKIPLERVITVSDDIALELGALRVRRSGSSGGHNGLRDIIAKCGGEGFPRVRVGVGAPPEGWEVIDWVLSKFTDAELKALDGTLSRAKDAVEAIITLGADRAMNMYNNGRGGGHDG
jgi:PTH1 family peptidyl-tRNA hydrolase